MNDDPRVLVFAAFLFIGVVAFLLDLLNNPDHY